MKKWKESFKSNKIGCELNQNKKNTPNLVHTLASGTRNQRFTHTRKHDFKYELDEKNAQSLEISSFMLHKKGIQFEEFQRLG